MRTCLHVVMDTEDKEGEGRGEEKDEEEPEQDRSADLALLKILMEKELIAFGKETTAAGPRKFSKCLMFRTNLCIWAVCLGTAG